MKMELSTTKVFKGDFATFKRHDGYLEAEYTPQYMTKIRVEKVVDQRLQIQDGKPARLLIHFPDLKYFSTDAKKYLRSEEGRLAIEKCAFIVDKTFYRFAVNLASWVSRLSPKRGGFPCMAFSPDKKEHAVAWLLSSSK